MVWEILIPPRLGAWGGCLESSTKVANDLKYFFNFGGEYIKLQIYIYTHIYIFTVYNLYLHTTYIYLIDIIVFYVGLQRVFATMAPTKIRSWISKSYKNCPRKKGRYKLQLHCGWLCPRRWNSMLCERGFPSRLTIDRVSYRCQRCFLVARLPGVKLV